jgi:radical SAM/Cys-rich protein
MDRKAQLAMLERMEGEDSFYGKLRSSNLYPLKALSVEVLQLNITRRCNLSCRHCHLHGSPDRQEDMSEDNVRACMEAAAGGAVSTLDITGGAPEMHPHFEWFLTRAAAAGKRLLVRSNGVVLLEEPYRSYPKLYAETGTELMISLPDLSRDRCDRVRGEGTFDRLIAALQMLNGLGYGMPGSGLLLGLVHNPVGAFLPGSQAALEEEYRSALRRDYGVEFNLFYCLANCPVGRYLEFLEKSGNLEEYFETLKRAFNPDAANRVMCRTTVSVGPDGSLFDCDFNQALSLPLVGGAPPHIRDFDSERLSSREIIVRSHCFACTAGAGSSCQGALKV